MTVSARIYPSYMCLRALGMPATRALAAVRAGHSRLWLRAPQPYSRFGMGTQALRLQAAYDRFQTLRAAMRNQRRAHLHQPRAVWWYAYQQARNPWGTTH